MPVDWQKIVEALRAREGGDQLSELGVGHILILARLDAMDANDNSHAEQIAELKRQRAEDMALINAQLADLKERSARIEAIHQQGLHKSGAVGAGAGTGGGILAAVLLKLLGG